MKYVDEYRSSQEVNQLALAIKKLSTKKISLMEICGGQTHSILKYGIDRLLPETIDLIHGPGCPVCITSVEVIDKAIEISLRKDVIFTSFGDMLRVPGSKENLFVAKSKGADLRIVYSPMDALKIARENPSKEVVFFAIGFETTAPANAMAVYQAKMEKINNFSILVSHMLVPPAIEVLLSSPNNKIKGFLAAGHVCTVMGYWEYEPIAEKYKTPIVVTGFEPTDILYGIYMCVKQIEEGRFEVENQYKRSVKRDGNIKAREMLQKIFSVTSATWRGIGEIPESGFGLGQEYSDFDAEVRFGKVLAVGNLETKCISGQILTGEKKPYHCSEFGQKCNPEYPLGATMVSMEGTCNAYYRYKK